MPRDMRTLRDGCVGDQSADTEAATNRIAKCHALLSVNRRAAETDLIHCQHQHGAGWEVAVVGVAHSDDGVVQRSNSSLTLSVTLTRCAERTMKFVLE